MTRIGQHTVNLHRARGITLMELMVVIGIAAIMLNVAAPAFVKTLNRGAQVSTVNDLVSGVHAARNHAVGYKRTFLLVPIEGDWSKGYQIKPTNIAAPSELDYTFPKDTKISVAVNPDIGFIRFDRLGRAQPANVVFEICNKETGKAANIDMTVLGNAVVRRVNNEMQQVNCVLN